jgi:hypothetical protein
LKIPLPDAVKNPVIDEVFLRFANDYLYVARSAKDLDPKALMTPKTFFVKDDGAVASLLVRGDRIPAEVKTFLIGQFELALAEMRKKNEDKSAAEKAGMEYGADLATSMAKSLLDDSKELTVRVYIDEKADEMSAVAVLTPKTGTPMAKYISSLAGKTSLPAGIVSAKGTAAHGSVKIAMTDDLKKRLGKLLDDVIADTVKNANGPEKDAIERVLKTLAPTAKAGELDFAAALYEPDAKGRHTLLAALAVKDGKDIEKLIRDFSAFAGGAADFTFDVEKIGDFNLHKITLNDMPEEVEKIFGTKTVWLAISNNHVVASVEPDGTAIRAGLKAKAVTVPVLNVEVSIAKLVPLFAKDIKPDELKAMLKDAFGEGGPAGKDTVTVNIAGGDQLVAKAKVKGKGVKLLIDLYQKR